MVPKERFIVRAQRSGDTESVRKTIIKLDEEEEGGREGGNIYGSSRHPPLSQALSLRYYT